MVGHSLSRILKMEHNSIKSENRKYNRIYLQNHLLVTFFEKRIHKFATHVVNYNILLDLAV